MKPILVFIASILTLGSAGSACVAQQPIADDIKKAIGKLDSDDSDIREDAAELLAESVMPKTVSPALKKCLKTESDFHVRLALNYSLACQGEKSYVEPLIESLNQKGHLGYVYLRRVTGHDFEWNVDDYQKWFESTTEKEFLDFINERWRRKLSRDEFAEFSSLYSNRFFGSMKSDDDELTFPDMRFTIADQNKIDSLPTAKAWAIFQNGLTELQEKGDRKEAARQFRLIATDYANTYYADQSRELADLLEKMVVEDRVFRKPENVASLDTKGQIEFHIHHLRDVVAYQFSQPGYCHVLRRFSISDEAAYNAADALRKIGEPAVPFLIELLEDRRPIRGVGYWRNFRPNRTVLRYQDAAIQIIDAIRSEQAYDRRTTSSYFSTERPEKRKEIIETLKANTK